MPNLFFFSFFHWLESARTKLNKNGVGEYSLLVLNLRRKAFNLLPFVWYSCMFSKDMLFQIGEVSFHF